MKLWRGLKKSLMLLIPFSMALGAGWYMRYESQFFLIDKMQVDLEFQENQEALVVSLKPQVEKALLGLQGQNIWSVSLRRLRQEVADMPWIADVELARRFPDQIVALVKLQPVVFLYMNKKNQVFPILKGGEKLPKIKASLAPPAPILRNNKIAESPEQLKKLVALYSEIPFIGLLKRENIASVDYDEVTGLTLRLIKNDLVVHFGNNNIQTKALQVFRVADYLESQKQKARVIDASFGKKVLVRLRKRS